MKITLVFCAILSHLRHHQLLATKENTSVLPRGITGKPFEFDLNLPPTPEITNVQESPRGSKDFVSDRCSQSNSLDQRAQGSFLALGSELRTGDNEGSRECSNMKEETKHLQVGVVHRQESSGTQMKTNSESQVNTYTSGSDSQNSEQDPLSINEIIPQWQFKRQRSHRKFPLPNTTRSGFENVLSDKQYKATFEKTQKDSILPDPGSRGRKKGIRLQKELFDLYEILGPRPLQINQRLTTKPGYDQTQNNRNRKVCVISKDFHQLESEDSKIKRKPRKYSDEFKAKVVKWHEDHRERQAITARKFKIPQSSLSLWLRDYDF